MSGRPVFQNQFEIRSWKRLNGGGPLGRFSAINGGPQSVLEDIKGRDGSVGSALLVSLIENLGADATPDTLRVVVSKKKPQFTVTVSPKGRATRSCKYGKGRQIKGYYTNRRGFSVPVLVWAENGTQPRYTKTTQGNRGGWLPSWMRDPLTGKRMRSHYEKTGYCGRMPAMGFMARTEVQVAPQVTDGLHEAVRAYTMKTAKKYGCKIT